MISFWVTQDGSFGLRQYRENRGRVIADRFQTYVYDQIGEVVRLPGGPQIFSALDRLTDGQKEIVARIWDEHAGVAPNALRLNDPRRVLLRFPLLTRLHQEHINSFRVFRASHLDEVDQFPVFVRDMHDHSGPRTGLLKTRSDVARALHALRLRGHRQRDLMIVEFCDISDADGLFRKYAAFKVGDRIIACHVFASHHWSVKSRHNEPTEDSVREGMRYVDDNPHEEWLSRVFAIAGTDFGRVDYGMANGVPQVWEINLNPNIGRGTGEQRHKALSPALKRLREDGREAFHAKLRAAFVALESGGDGSEVIVTFDRALLDRLNSEATAEQRRRRILRWLQHRPVLSPLRAIFAKLVPRPPDG